MDGKQAAVLVPTTTLAFQHHRTFTARMTPFGVRVKVMSRFVAPKVNTSSFSEVTFDRTDWT